MSLSTQGIAFGAYTPIRYLNGKPGDLAEAIEGFEQTVGRRMDLCNSFKKWLAPSGEWKNAQVGLSQITNGRIPMITWEPCLPDRSPGSLTLADIASGKHDEYVLEWARGLKAMGKRVYIRFMHEMNGTWYWWAGNPEAYVRAWRHVVGVFRDVGADNVAWVWCVNCSDQPKDNDLELYWPGAEYVSVLGIDGYNGYAGWRSFEDIIRPAYERVTALDPHAGVFICETASSEAIERIKGSTGQSKAQWIRDMFATEGMPAVRALLWFDENNPRSYDWRLASSDEARRAMAVQLYRAEGWVAAPGPYVPPVPDRVKVTPDGPGAVVVSWRVVPSFTRGYKVLHLDGGTHVVDKPATSVRIAGLKPGRHEFAVASYTLVRASGVSEWVACEVTE